MKKYIIKGLFYLAILGIGIWTGHKLPKLLWGKAESNIKTTISENKDATLNDLLGTYTSDTSQNSTSSEISFLIESEEAPTHGKFNDFIIHLNAQEDFTRSEIKVLIDARSITTGLDMRDESLVGEDFFNTDSFPDISFTSRAISNYPYSDSIDYISTGKLNMLGVDNYLNIQFNLEGTGKNKDGKEIAIFKGNFSFDRTQYGMSKDEGINDTVHVEFTTELIKQ